MEPSPKLELPTRTTPESEIELDLLKKVYPITEWVDETGKLVSSLRGEYECGSGDEDGFNSGCISENLYEPRNFKRRTRWLSWIELQYEHDTERDLIDLNQRFEGTVTTKNIPPGWPYYNGQQVQRIAPPLEKSKSKLTKLEKKAAAQQKLGHITLYGREYVPHTQYQALATQNPVIATPQGSNWGYVRDGCGEDRTRHYCPVYHPVTQSPDYEYWDEKHYLKVFKYLKEISPDCYNLLHNDIDFSCRGKHGGELTLVSHIVYINPHNHQVYAWCSRCCHDHVKYPWHQIKDKDMLEGIGEELNIELIKYHKEDIEDILFDLIYEYPGINKYQICQETGMTKGMITRGLKRLKNKGSIHTRRIGKATHIYPKRYEMGTDLL